MIRNILLLFSFLVVASSLFGQTEEEKVKAIATRGGDPTAYPVASLPETEEMQYFDARFPEQGVGFMHVYADPEVGPNDDQYLFSGIEMDNSFLQYLPKKYQRMATRMNATLYPAAAIKGINESNYILRLDGPTNDRLEMFAIRGDKVKHLKTLAYKQCLEGQCMQMDSYLTDIDKDGNLDLIQITKRENQSGIVKERKMTYKMVEPKRKWKKADFDDTPWSSVSFYEEGMYEN